MSQIAGEALGAEETDGDDIVYGDVLDVLWTAEESDEGPDGGIDVFRCSKVEVAARYGDNDGRITRLKKGFARVEEELEVWV